MEDLLSYLGPAVKLLELLERHPTVTKGLVALLIAFGTPQVGPRDKPWIQRRDGLVLPLIRLGAEAVRAYIQRTQVWKDFELEAKAFREERKADRGRMHELERVVSWQTQVSIAIANALGLDIMSILHRPESDAPVSSTAVSVVAGISSPAVPRDMGSDGLGKQVEKSAQSSPAAS